jgi:hypothetical protein
MNKRFAAPAASAVAAILMLSACGDDDASSAPTTGSSTTSNETAGPTTLAKGEDVNFVGGAPGLSDQMLDITAEEEGGEVTGEARFSPAELILDLECADTDTEGLVVIGGEATADAGDGSAKGDRVAVIIREGSPDGVIIWFEQPLPEGEVAAGSCDEFLDAIPPDEISEDALFADVADGDDIETG